MNKNGLFGRMDWQIIIVTIIISSIGVVLISSATLQKANQGLWLKQLLVLALGSAVMIAVSLINYRILLKLSWLIYSLSIISMIAVLMLGKIAGGAQSWISIAGFSFQPSEFAKVALILVMAHYFSNLDKSKLELLDLIKPGIILAIPLFLAAAQPDLGTAATMVPLFLGVSVVAGLSGRSILALLLIMLILVSFVWMFVLKDYQRERIRSFFNPTDDIQKSGYQIQQSLIAIGSGGLLGKGLFLGSQSQLSFVPAQHTDFIFTVLGEEMGFIAVFFVLSLYAMIFLRALLRLESVHGVAGIYIVVGTVSYLAFQTIINVLMSIGLFPTTGVPLPFLSYGGSSLMANMIAIGLVVSVFNYHAKNTKVQM
jgi:rod shape determining protein RodA